AGHHRPEGTAEHWLSAVSDLGRKGVRADARRRLADLAAPTSVRPLVAGVDTGGRHGFFTDLEVGRAAVVDGLARVPYRVHQYAAHGKHPVVEGTVVLQRRRDSWRVAGLSPRRRGETVPSEGGAPPSRASWSLWLLAVAIGVALAVLSSALVAWADRSARRPLVTHG